MMHMNPPNFDVLATGYERSLLHPFLDPIAGDVADLSVDCDDRLRMREGFLPRIYLQGYSETSHGLSDTLLSVLAVRSRENARSLFEPGTATSEARI